MSDWYDGADAGPIDEQWKGDGFDTGGGTFGETGLETGFGKTGFEETGFETGVETGGREYGVVKVRSSSDSFLSPWQHAHSSIAVDRERLRLHRT